jgi:endonuclease G
MVINKLRSIINFTNSKLLLNNGGFIINYSPELGRPIWTAYSVNKFDIEKQTGGRMQFVCDQRLEAKNIYQLAPNSNIFNSQITRGHLVPAFMMSHLKTHPKAWQKTFLMSNVVPQVRKLNTEGWYKLEKDTKAFITKSNSNIHVIVGCDSLEVSKKIIWTDTNNKKEYSIPNIFYQVVITDYEAICHIGMNNSNHMVQQVSLDFLENLIDKKLLI